MVAYDDMAVEKFKSGKGEDEDNEWQDDEPIARGIPSNNASRWSMLGQHYPIH